MRFPLSESFVISVHKEGEKFVMIFAFATFILFFINSVLCTIGFFATLFCIAFFRDPDRIIPKDLKVAVSPGDGKVTKVAIVEAPSEIKSLAGQEMLKISIFLSVFDAHVNRSPVRGRVIETVYTPGRFVSAALDKSSSENERNAIVLKTDAGDNVGCIQIAGLIARRIVSEAKEGNEYDVGARYGIIRFGSRMDVYLPVNKYSACVAEGQTVIAGETVIAKLQH